MFFREIKVDESRFSGRYYGQESEFVWVLSSCCKTGPGILVAEGFLSWAVNLRTGLTGASDIENGWFKSPDSSTHPRLQFLWSDGAQKRSFTLRESWCKLETNSGIHIWSDFIKSGSLSSRKRLGKKFRDSWGRIKENTCYLIRSFEVKRGGGQ